MEPYDNGKKKKCVICNHKPFSSHYVTLLVTFPARCLLHPLAFFLSQTSPLLLLPFVFSSSLHAFSLSSVDSEVLLVSLLVALVFYFLVTLLVELLVYFLGALVNLVTFFH